MSVEFDVSALRSLIVHFDESSEKVLKGAPLVVKKSAFGIEGRAKARVKVDTGNLRNSISTSITDGGFGAEIGPTSSYGYFVEVGVPHPYVIRAKGGGMLRFVVDGHVVYAKQVTHPASAPAPYMGPSWDEEIPLFEQAMGQLGADSL